MGSTEHILTMATLTGKGRQIEGDWEMITEKCPVPEADSGLPTWRGVDGGSHDSQGKYDHMSAQGRGTRLPPNKVSHVGKRNSFRDHRDGTRDVPVPKEGSHYDCERRRESKTFVKWRELCILYGQEVPGTGEKTDLLIPGSHGERERCLTSVFIGTLCLFIIFYCHDFRR